MGQNEKMKCNKCGGHLEKTEVRFSYLNNYCSVNAYRCPSCGQTFIPESLVDGDMHKWETILENRRLLQT